jgi:hypothetical protein
MEDVIFKVGDLVTRDGTDIHRVTSSNDDGYGNIDVVCVKAPDSGWSKVGDCETNLARRYEFIKTVID